MHSASQTLCRIARVVAVDLGVNVTERELQQATQLDQVIALDSIALLELAMGLEREFAIRFDAACMERDFLMDVAGLVKYLDRNSGVDSH